MRRRSAKRAPIQGAVPDPAISLLSGLTICRTRAVLATALAATTLVAVTGTGICDPIANFVAREKNIHYKIDLVVHGKPISIDRTVHCDPFFSGELSSPFDIYYRPDRSALSLRLPDGSGLIVIVPNYCYYSYSPAEASVDVPPVGYVDDVRDPQRLDLYVSKNLLRAPDSPVQVRSFSADISRERGASGFDEEFAAWRVINSTAPDVGEAFQFRGLLGFALGYDGNDAKIVETKSYRLTVPTLVAGSDLVAIWWQRHGPFDLAIVLAGGFRQTKGSPSIAPTEDADSDVVPFARDDRGVFSPDFGKRGIVILYRTGKEEPARWSPRVTVGTAEVPVTLESMPALYLPDRKLFLLLTSISQAWAPTHGAPK